MTAIQAAACFRRGLRAVAKPAHRQRIGKTGDAEADPPLGPRFRLLLEKRIIRDIDDRIEKPNGHARALGKCTIVEARIPPRTGAQRRP